MEVQLVKEVNRELLSQCANECTNNAQKCKEQGMDDCARLCIACAAACRKAIAEGQDNPLLFDECEAASKACATECELHPHQHCMDCAEICRQVEVDCRNRMAVKAGI